MPNSEFEKINELEIQGLRITPRAISENFNIEISDSIELFNDWKRTKKKPICEDCE